MSFTTIEPGYVPRARIADIARELESRIGSLSETQPEKAAARSVCCSNCFLRTACLPCGLDRDALAELDELTRLKRRVQKGAAIYRTGDALDSLYAVHSGSFKTASISRGGEEKVTGMHLPGEIMGLDAINGNRHGYDAVALEDSEVCTIPFMRLRQLALRIPELQRQLFRVISADISRDHGLMLLLGGMGAEERVAAFLLSLSRRYEKLGYAPTSFSVRMTRGEIGSYLGLKIETVSRIFARLQREGLIAARKKQVELKDFGRLREKFGCFNEGYARRAPSGLTSGPERQSAI